MVDGSIVKEGVLKRRRIRRSPGDFVFDVIVTVLLSAILIVIGYPLIYVLSSSFSGPDAIIGGKVWLLPKDFTTLGYTTIFNDSSIVRGFLNSVKLVVIGTSINIALTVLVAYPLSVRDFYGRKGIMIFLTVTMFFSGGLVPLFLLTNNIGLYDNFFALVLVPAGGFSVYNAIVARTFFQTNIPHEMYEAAELDGCSDAFFLLRIVLPLAKPILAVLVLYYAVGHWNAYFYHMIFLESKTKFTFQLILRNILIRNQTNNMVAGMNFGNARGITDLLKYSLIVVSSLPMLLLYPFIQKHFVKGVMVGALKG